jgi:ketosteroid isomerase-like protein
MSEQNVEIVRSVSEPFAGIDVAGIDWGSEAIREAIGAVYSEDTELTTLASGLGTGVDGFYKGLDGLVQYLQDWLEPFSEYHVQWLDYVDAGEIVLVPSRQWGVGAASGARAELELTYLYELRDGKVVRVHQYDTLAEARAAAERPE